MDSLSSSVGSPISGNTESPENTFPLHSTSVGFPSSGNIQSSEISQPIPSSSVEIAQSSQNTQSVASNGPPTLIVSNVEWNQELVRFFPNLDFCFFMKTGACEEPFGDWYRCAHRVMYAGGNMTECYTLAGALRDCVFSNQAYHRSLLNHFSQLNQG